MILLTIHCIGFVFHVEVWKRTNNEQDLLIKEHEFTKLDDVTGFVRGLYSELRETPQIQAVN